MIWRDFAACRGSDPEQFTMPVVWSNRRPPGRRLATRIHRAKTICASCPVLPECRHEYMTTEPDYWCIAGGLTPQERAAKRQRRTA